jgi:hypothetical protein
MVVLIGATAGFESVAVGRRPMASRVVQGMMRRTTYASMLLGKIPISTSWAQRRAMPMVYARYGECIIGLLALAGWRGEPKS